MTYTLIPSDLAHLPDVLCWYKNSSTKTQIARIENIEQWYFERRVLPGESLLFEAPQAAVLDVFDGRVTTLLIERIHCQDLRARQTADWAL
jgi:hypothetical protein